VYGGETYVYGEIAKHIFPDATWIESTPFIGAGALVVPFVRMVQWLIYIYFWRWFSNRELRAALGDE